jgi:hypothetical protein
VTAVNNDRGEEPAMKQETNAEMPVPLYTLDCFDG